MTTTDTTITRQLLDDEQRLSVPAEIFSFDFLRLEMAVYAMTDNLSPDYKGGFWDFYLLSNGAFFMAPSSDKQFRVVCDNGFEGELSADALGIVASLYAYSHQSFGGPSKFAETCAEQYHLLREYMFDHAEVATILSAID